MKNLILFYSIITILNVNAQDKEINLNFKEKHKYAAHIFTHDGKFLLVTANNKPSNSGLCISKFDSDLNLKLEKTLDSNLYSTSTFFGGGSGSYLKKEVYDFETSYSGEKLISNTDKFVMNDKGDFEKYDFIYGKFIDEYECKFYRFSNKFGCYFGNKKDKSTKSKLSDEVYLFRVNLNNLSDKKFIELKFPEFKTLISGEIKTSKKEEGKKEWGLSSFDNDKMIMLNKEINTDFNEDQYNIVEMDYDGNVLDKKSVSLKLDNKFFACSDNGFGSSTIIHSYMVSAGLMHSNATGNVSFDKNGDFYIYGLFTKSKFSNMNIISFHGFYVYKFNSKGELLWKQEKDIIDKDFNQKQRPIAITLDFFIQKDNIAISMSSFYEKYFLFYSLNSNDGNVINSHKPKIKIEGGRLEAIVGSSFPTGYVIDEKDFDKKHFDLDALTASYLNPKVEKYFKNSSENDLNYSASISENGIHIIEEDYKAKTYKYLKFNR